MTLSGLAAALVGLGIWGGHAAGEQAGIDALHENVLHRVEIYIGSLRSELRRYEYLPAVMVLNARLINMLEHPGDRDQVQEINLMLERAAYEAGASAIYVLDARGLTLAASNWNQRDSFVGANFSYRPYFRDAVHGIPGRFYGIGTVSREPGYYFSHPIYKDGALIGVAVLKVNLERLDEGWSTGQDDVLVVDNNNVIFLTSQPRWRYKTLGQLSPATRDELADTQQYSMFGSLEPIGFRLRRQLNKDVSIMQARADGRADGTEYLAQSFPVPDTRWRLVVLSNMAPIRQAARNGALLASAGFGFLSMLALTLHQRRRTAQHNRLAKAALQRAHDELERKVELRTQALSTANALLLKEVAERTRAERVLKNTTEELVHAGRMAALGQMSASVTHELNQPLAALRTIAANTIVFFRRGNTREASANLALIGDLVERMGKITGQLKKFAYKTPVRCAATPVAAAISDTLMLLQARAHEENVALEFVQPDADLHAWCEPTRLGQVMLNLVGNALDAVRGRAPAWIRVTLRGEAGALIIEVRDNGPGLADDVKSRLFEPFFTTKEQGNGLGLGLAISSEIVRGFGGTLCAWNHPAGGAVFCIRLPRRARTQEAMAWTQVS